MKILIISTNADEAGAPKHVETLVNGLEGIYNFFLIFGERGPVSDRLNIAGHKVFIIDNMRSSFSPIKDLISFFQLKKIVLSVQPDIIHCHSTKAGMLGRLVSMFSNAKCIYTVHGWGWRGKNILEKFIIKTIERVLYLFAKSRYIYVSESVYLEGVSSIGIKDFNGTIVHNGMPQIKIDTDIDDEPLTILMPARVSSAKDHFSMLLAFEELKSINIRLLLCGSGTDSKYFIEYAKSIAPNSFHNISFLGERSDMSKVYNSCHVVALISNFEAFPLVLIEALSCGRSIIATDVGGVSEIIQNNYNGILVKHADVKEITNAIIHCLKKDNRNVFYKNGISIYNQKYTDDIMINNVKYIYNCN